MFIVFEGTDGSGTSTQAKKLAESLQQKGLKTFSTAEPTKNFLGKTLREVLQKKKSLSPKAFQLLFFADREEHLQNEILPALKRGEVVICERYNWSSLAYGQAEGVEKKFLENVAKSFLKPDYTFFMDIPAEKSLERIKKREEETGLALEHFETQNTLSTVREVMRNLAEGCMFTKRASVIDASETPEKIFSRVEMVLTPLLFLESFTAE
jgi:dTMP kinase